ncbi:hypothetical protein ACOMHN_034987 [Nucella lapillus]
MALNLSLLLLLHSPWVHPGPLVLDYPYSLNTGRSDGQLDNYHNHLNHHRGPPRGSRFRAAGDSVGEEGLQRLIRKNGKREEKIALNIQDLLSSREEDPQPRLKETVSKNSEEKLLALRYHPKPVETVGDEPSEHAINKPEKIQEQVMYKQKVPNSRDLDIQPKLKQTDSNNTDKKQAQPHQKPAETVGHESLDHATKKAESEKNKKLSNIGKPVPKPQTKQAVANSSDTKEPELPWLYKPENMSRLEQVVQSLEVFLDDDDQASWKHSSYFQPRASVQTSFRPRVLIDSVHCPPEGPRVLILIPSVWVSSNVRQAIRTTWASPAYGGHWPGDARNLTSLVKVVFVLGVKPASEGPNLEEEARKFRDIVQLDFQETYFNLSLKMALAVEWSVHRCPGADHVMKVDDDTFVELSLLLDLLQHLSEYPPFVLGYRHRKAKPRVSRSGKWAVNPKSYPFPHFPRYVYGHSYVFSSEAARKVQALWRHMPLVRNEDAYLTGILSKAAGVTRIHCEWFARDNRQFRLPLPKEELANGRSISQTGFRPFRNLFTEWEMVRKTFGGLDV